MDKETLAASASMVGLSFLYDPLRTESFPKTLSHLNAMSLYQTKVEDYFSAARKDILDVLPAFSQRVLEIGCGSGQTLELLKRLKRCESTVGIELFEQAAKDAQTRADKVHHLDIEKQAIPDDLGKFDLILILDVLEHLVDPWSLLERIQRVHLKPSGNMIISLPNARHFSCLLPLVVKGEFTYKERGILDKTHLRFFTRKSGIKMVQEAGLSIEKFKRTGLDWSYKSGRLNTLTFGLFSEFLTSQFIYLTHATRDQDRTQ